MAKAEPNRRTIYVPAKVWRFWVRLARKEGLSVSAALRKAMDQLAEERVH